MGRVGLRRLAGSRPRVLDTSSVSFRRRVPRRPGRLTGRPDGIRLMYLRGCEWRPVLRCSRAGLPVSPAHSSARHIYSSFSPSLRSRSSPSTMDGPRVRSRRPSEVQEHASGGGAFLPLLLPASPRRLTLSTRRPLQSTTCSSPVSRR